MSRPAEYFASRLQELQKELALLQQIALEIGKEQCALRCLRKVEPNYPPVGTKYYVPMPGKKNKVATYTWEGTADDRRLHERGLVFYTPDRAAYVADLMLAAIS